MKIFVVVGTLFPFDRLVRVIDNWASENRNIKVIGQIGHGSYKPDYMVYYNMLKSADFNKIFDESDLIITHAGMGIVLKSLVAGKPIVILPRKFILNEHTTDHQMATAEALHQMNYVNIAWENEDLLQYLKNPSSIASKMSIGEFAAVPLVSAIRQFIEEN